MLRIQANHFSPQPISCDRLRSSFSPPFAQAMFLFDGLSRNDFAYSSLPDDDISDVPSSPVYSWWHFADSESADEPMKLSVGRLDGSSFEVEVTKSATVANLRQAIHDAFSDLPGNNSSNISWKHVWGHFCLCYNGHKLVNETDLIMNFGIKDGDQLHFARHLTIVDMLEKTPSKKKAAEETNLSKAAREEENGERIYAGYEPISTQDDDFGDIEKGGWKWQ